MSRKMEIAKLAREIKEIKSALNGSTNQKKAMFEILEIYEFPGSNAELSKEAKESYPYYKGEDIDDLIKEFTKKSTAVAKKELNISDDLRAVYLGYDIKSDTIYMGFASPILAWRNEVYEDLYGNEYDNEYVADEEEGTVVVKIKNNKIEIVHTANGWFWGDGEGYRYIKKQGIADIFKK